MSKTAVGLLPVVVFDVRSPSLPFSMYYVGTYWALEPDVYITAQGRAMIGERADPLPNMRLKLAAPSCCCSLLFVKTVNRRRSLGAPR